MAEEDLLVHVHVPKCGGTSVWMWLAAAHPSGHGNLYPRQHPGYVFDEARLRALGTGDPKLRSMSTHNIRTFAPVVCGRNMRYFTFLRDPVQHFISYFRYIKQIYAETDAEMRAGFPENFPSISSRDYAAWLLEAERDVPFRSGYQTDFFASYVWRRLNGRGPDANAPAFPRWEPEDWADYRRERLAVAKLTLRSFAAVGVLERLHAGLTVVRERSRAWGFSLPPPDEVPFENATEEPADDVSWLVESDPVGRAYVAALADDRELHAFAGTLLDAALAALG